MKLSFFKKVTFPSIIIFLIVFELFVFSVFSKSFWGHAFGREILPYLFAANTLVLTVLCFLFVLFHFLNRGEYYKTILLILLNFCTIVFLYFSPHMVFAQVAIIFSLISYVLLLLNIEGWDRVVFVNLISFFTVLLFFFTAYSLIANSILPYWLVILAVILFSVFILFYKLKSIGLEDKFRELFIIIFAIIISEFFLFFFFAPIKSLFIKSLFLVFIYYFYWGMVDLYIRNIFNKKNIIIFFGVFLSLIFVGMLYIFIGGGIK